MRDVRPAFERDLAFWQVDSSSDFLTWYIVSRVDEEYACTCPGYKWRGRCKHIDEVKKCLRR